MPFYFFVWSDEIEAHIAAHGVTPEEFEQVVCDPDRVERSHSSTRPVAFGATTFGSYVCVYGLLDNVTVLPETACEEE